jgi:hypothetical protein
LTLTWTAVPGGADVASYQILAGSRPEESDVANFLLPGTATSFSAVVGGNAVFYVRVLAYVRFSGPQAPSNEIVVVLGTAVAPPLPPIGLTAVAVGRTVTLGWSSPNGQPVTSYLVQVGSRPGSSDLANFSTGTGTTTLSTAGVAVGTYYLRVRTLNAAGISTPSNEVQVDVISTCLPPDAPSGLAVSVTGSTVSLTWIAGAGASSYELQVGSSPGSIDLAVQDLRSASTSFVAWAVPRGTYFIRVRSKSACGASTTSNEVALIIL